MTSTIAASALLDAGDSHQVPLGSPNSSFRISPVSIGAEASSNAWDAVVAGPKRPLCKQTDSLWFSPENVSAVLAQTRVLGCSEQASFLMPYVCAHSATSRS